MSKVKSNKNIYNGLITTFVTEWLPFRIDKGHNSVRKAG